jgi:4'-phosphopantetheinyl transferase
MHKLPPAAVQLFFDCCPTRLGPHELAMLGPAEQQACKRLATEFLQTRYVCAHLLLRKALRQFAGMDTSTLALSRGLNRRPRLALQQPALRHYQSQQLDFNLSYSGPLVACAVARGVRVGVDIEAMDAGLRHEQLAGRVFSDYERASQVGRDSATRRQVFFQTWVLKEAWAKARGEGLGLPFSEVTLMPVDQPPGVQARLDAAQDDPQRWRFLRGWLSSDDSRSNGQRTEWALACSPAINTQPGCHAAAGVAVHVYAHSDVLSAPSPTSN